MRRPVDAARPARYALLGLLLDGPRHGYDLLRAFGPSTPLGSTIHLGTSHLYSLLARLEQDGLIAGEDQPQEGHPPRRVFRLTEEGRATVVSWLEEPVARPRDVLLDFPLKLYLAHHRDAEQATRLIGRQRAQFAEYLAALEQEELPPASPEDRVFLALLRDGRISRTQATLAWLDRCAVMLGIPAPKQ
jgi:DNA-binding PadR family transcriptional regulator